MSSINSDFAKAPKRLFALVDCNSFYASCERVFRPDLVGKPVVVLSNNDGCIVSRSAEAKALGIAMAEPEFKVRSLLKKHNVAVFSSNYALYGDISRRVMAALESLCPQVEQYSIDEAFIPLDSALAANAHALALSMRARVLQWTGITVSVGIGPTRTLAKLANLHAKKSESGFVCVPLPNSDGQGYTALLQDFPVGQVWGIGRKQALKCQARGISTALQLQQADDAWIKNTLTVTGWQTALELRGIACIGMNKAPIPRKTLVSSRSFAQKIFDKNALCEALSTFAARAGERLRREKLMASGIGVHIRTSKHEQQAYHDASTQITFRHPANESLHFIKAAQQGLESLYKTGYGYTKAGVILFGLEEQSRMQGNLLTMDAEAARKPAQELTAALDRINARYGKRSLYFGAEGADKAVWHMRQNNLSPRLTTHWNELAKVILP